jgi:hypothetical protein
MSKTDSRPTWVRTGLKLALHSALPAAAAIAYAAWNYSTLIPGERTLIKFVTSFFGAFFLGMWFSGQWFRTSKQISDNEMHRKLDRISASLGDLHPEAEGTDAKDPALVDMSYEDGPVGRVMAELPRSSKGALLVVGAEIEKEIRTLMWTSGWIKGVKRITITDTAAYLVSLGVVPANLGASVEAFLKIRNPLLHGRGVSDDEVIRGVDIGLTILRAILSVPKEINFVFETGVRLYADAACMTAREGVWGLLLKTQSPGASTFSYRIVPTTRTDYEKNQRLSWEWDLHKGYEKTWYRKSNTNEIILAWDSSAEFVGRPMEQLASTPIHRRS